MKNNRFCMATLLAAALLCGACNEDNEKEDLTHGRCLTLQFADGSLTRTVGDDSQTATTDEKTITSVRVFLTDANNAHSNLIEIDPSKITLNITADVATVELPVDATGMKYVYALVNDPTGSTFSVSTFADLKNAVSGTQTSVAKLWEDGHFAMFNRQNELTTASDCLGGIEINLNSTPVTDPIAATVYVERLAVKVVADIADDITYEPVGQLVEGNVANWKITDMVCDGVALANCVTDVSLLQQWNEGGAYNNDRDMLLYSPSSENTYSLTDGYYARLGTDALTFVEPGTALYCLENNSPVYSEALATATGTDYQDLRTEGTRMKGRTTAVVYRVKAKTISGLAWMEGLIKDPDVGTWSAAPATRGGDTPGDYQTFYRYNGKLYISLSDLCVDHPEITATTTDDLRMAGVEVFENGYMYYVHYITDMNYTDGGNHYYSVMRNTVYDLTLNSISSLGSDTPEGMTYEATDPIDVDYPNVNISVTFGDWVDKTGRYTL